MNPNFDAKNPFGNFDAKGMYETWERASTAWFETWSKSPAFLAAMGKTLEAQLGTKTGADKMVQTWLEAWKIPTTRDLESLTDRLASLEERVGDIEEGLGGPAQAPNTQAPATQARG